MDVDFEGNMSAHVHSVADEKYLSTFGCHWDDLLLGLT
jgi:hypothetical protein